MQIGKIENQSVMESKYFSNTNSIQEKDDIKVNSSEEKKLKEIKDIYVSSEEEKKEPTGLYRVVSDDNGNKKIEYDKIEKVDQKEKNQKANMYYVNTDKVDREIEKLKKLKIEIEKRLAQLSDVESNYEEKQKLEQRLKQINEELSVKDNDSYRKSNSEKHS